MTIEHKKDEAEEQERYQECLKLHPESKDIYAVSHEDELPFM